MDQAQVVTLMESSNSSEAWSANIDTVKAAFGGNYPDFWYAAIVESGVASRTAAKFGQMVDLKVSAFAQKPLSIHGRPVKMPVLRSGEKVVGIYDQGLGEKSSVCNTIADMQHLYDSYASGIALRLRWVIATHSQLVIQA